ncbi:Pls/PosA family non-ribosomal peptide synthetase [Aureimonas ureilytica]|uniref:Pls/PosA family non-ribosomal peptide synthetase n=1 Tax=Aureimonas ureilytica TaxID=401562 RepID=UPI00036BE6AA|nr:Pls/PosA family non-ribosomal peptide synthetase [Aureimonas ureilytica]
MPDHASILKGASFRADGPPDQRLDAFFAQRAARYGALPAVVSDGRTWSYAEIDARANQLAHALVRRGVRPGNRVGLLLDRSAMTYVAILAVMKAGAVFVPLATAFPPERMALIVEDAAIELVITVSAYALNVERLPVAPLFLDQAQAEIDAETADAPFLGALVDDSCYILYTSGTTGRPKGVVIRHPSITNFVQVAAAAYGYKLGDRVYQGMTVAFDFSTEEIWVPLAAGCTIYPAPGRLTLVGEELSDFLRAHSITCMACSPTLLSSIESDVPSLRLLLVGGEACPQNLVQRWEQPGREILNTYGPTEATVTATMGRLVADRAVTIGAPLPSYTIVLLDAAEPRLAEPGEMGEIGIAGIGLAAGYLNRDDLTAEKFIPDFLDLPDNPSHRIYRTGDLGRINAEGEVEYHGRIDTQIKIRGYRIELGEIEAALLDQPGIAQAAVTAVELQPGRTELVAYYAPKAGSCLLAKGEISAELKRRLPDYMVPTYLEELDALPMTVANKVDLRQLPKPKGGPVALERPVTPPRNEDERFLLDAAKTVLGLDEISVEDHFFDDLGANSLLMARFCARVRAKPAWATTSMRDIYLFPSVALLAEHLRTPEEIAEATHESVLTHRATDFAYWATGAAQLLFYGLYSYFGLWVFDRGLDWVYVALDQPWQLYLRCVALSAFLFFGMSGLAVGAKWLLIGRWKPEAFPLWGLRYYRFWVVQTLIRTAPVVLFKGSPLYSLYLKLLGARIGHNTIIECRTIPVCTDLIRIGDNAILRKESMILGYHARAGYMHTGPVEVGHGAFVGVGCVLDIDTRIGDNAQLGHSSSLQRGQTIPDGERWHGSPAVPTDADYCKVRSRPISEMRRILFEVVQLVLLFAIVTPFPLLFHSYWQNVSDNYQETIGIVAIGTTVTLVGIIALSLAVALLLPRLARFVLKPGRTYTLYGFHYLVQNAVEFCTNSRILNLLFGDSSAAVHYLRALGWNLNEITQTGSNFGSNQVQENPLLCEIGSQTMVSDGLFMINMHKSASSFQLEHTRVGERNYFGNNIFFPADSRTGDNVLLGTKVMVPIDGPVRENVGLLGSPPFEIPRMVSRDKELIAGVSEAERRVRVRKKNRHNALTALFFLGTQWLELFIALVIADRALNYYDEWGATALFVGTILVMAIELPLHVLIERASLRFGKLRPRMTTIYDRYFWFHERHWKLSDSPVINLFPGTPFRPLMLRLLGTEVGRRVYDGGANLTERSLVSIGDDATLNERCVIQAHSLEEGAFKSDTIRIGNGCTVGPAAFVHYGVTMGDEAIVDTDSFVMKGEVLEPGSIWRGNPATLHRFAAPVRSKGLRRGAA